MKIRRTLLTGSRQWIVCAVLGITSICRSVDAETATLAKKPATNAPPTAVFVIPHMEKEGMRDPFYPKSTRIFDHAPVPVTPTTPVIVRIELKLQGFSGPPNHRLAIINGRTLELGEEAEVPTAGGKVSVHCLEFKADAVIVQANGERYELKMRSGI